MKELCPETRCIKPELPKELKKELCPQPKQPTPKKCTMVVTKVTANNINLQHEKTYNKVCSTRHKLYATEIFKPNKKVPKIVDLCPPCTK